jgi:hypothetical protein
MENLNKALQDLLLSLKEINQKNQDVIKALTELAEFEPIGGEDDVEGVGDEKEKLPMPEDDEIDSMVESESKEYMTAHG